MASGIYVKAAQDSEIARATADGGFKPLRGLRDGTALVVPWIQALVFEGRVFGAHAGSITTGIAGHASVDADQPEMAVRVPDGTEALPLYLSAEAQSFETTLGIHGLMFAVSNIDVGNGTSTAATEVLNLRLDSPQAVASTVRHTYSGNGTDPLTAGNFLELGREAGVFDSDAATSGIKGLTLRVSAQQMVMPVVIDAGSILGYGEGGTTANFFFHMIWAEFSEGALS